MSSTAHEARGQDHHQQPLPPSRAGDRGVSKPPKPQGVRASLACLSAQKICCLAFALPCLTFLSLRRCQCQCQCERQRNARMHLRGRGGTQTSARVRYWHFDTRTASASRRPNQIARQRTSKNSRGGARYRNIEGGGTRFGHFFLLNSHVRKSARISSHRLRARHLKPSIRAAQQLQQQQRQTSL